MRVPFAVITALVSDVFATPLFARSGLSIVEASADNLLQLYPHPNPQNIAKSSHGRKPPTGDAIVNTIFSGVYPVVNVTWGGSVNQSFISFIDTGRPNQGYPDMAEKVTDISRRKCRYIRGGKLVPMCRHRN